jgi:long-chain acyl-CoA synthetase
MISPSPRQNLYDALRAGATNRDRGAIEFGDEAPISYGELFALAENWADELARLGVRAGERVAFLSYNRPAILELYLAVAKIGAVLVPINPELSPPETAYVLDHSQPVIAYWDEQCRLRLEEAMALAKSKPRTLPFPTRCDSPEPASSERASLAPEAGLASNQGGSDPLVICYTSGSTGRAKGILASHAIEIASAESYREIWRVSADDRMLIALPLAYLYGLTTAGLTALSAGSTIVLLERFHPASVADAIEYKGATIFMGVPTMFAMLADYAHASGRAVRGRGLRLAISAGAPLSPQIAQRFEAAFGVAIQEFYALSEIRPVFAFRADSTEPRPAGSAGRPARGVEVRLIGDNGQAVGIGMEGDLLVRSPTLMLGYYRDPALTAEAIREGWFITGDRARVDKEGRYFIVGRVKDLIIRGGAKIAPAEVEAVLTRHPAIGAAAVVGVPDPLFGEIVKAAVVARPGAALDAEDVRNHCARFLASFKVPAQIVVLDRLPTGPTGKVLKRAIIEAG